MLPVGEAQQTADLLLSKLAEHQIFPVPVGTLEKFVPTVGNHGNKWLSGVLERYGLGDDKLADARRFIKSALRMPSDAGESG